MGKRDDLIAQYADDLKNKFGIKPDLDLLTKITISCGPSIYNAVESLFSKLKDWRLIITRYDRCAHTSLAAIKIA